MMQNIESKRSENWRYGSLGGAVAGVAAAFAYAVVFVVYATLRSSLPLLAVQPDASVPGTAVAYAASLVVATLAITALMAIPAALVGMLTGFFLKRLLSMLNLQGAPRQAVLAGTGACLSVVMLLHLVFQRALGFTPADAAANAETYLLWLGLPSLIYVAVGAAMSARFATPVEVLSSSPGRHRAGTDVSPARQPTS